MNTQKGMGLGLLMLLILALGGSSALALVHHTDENGDVIVMPSNLHPSDDIAPAFDGDMSCAVINPNYILTAAHWTIEEGMTVDIGGTTYRLANHVEVTDNNDTTIDLEVIRIETLEGNPANLTNWARLNDYSEIGQTVTIGGLGRTNALGDSRIFCDPEAPDPTLVCGYNDRPSWDPILQGYAVTWGTNKVDSIITGSTLGVGKTWGPMQKLVIDFDAPEAADNTSYEVQAKQADSGAGWFIQDGSIWRLCGITVGIKGTSAEGPVMYRDTETGQILDSLPQSQAVRISAYQESIIEAANSIKGTTSGWVLDPILETTSWTGNLSTTWENSQNWSNGVPTASDIVKIDSNSCNPMIYPQSASAKDVYVGVTTSATINHLAEQFNVAGTLEIGAGTGGFGTYNMTGGELNAKVINIGFRGGSGYLNQTAGEVTAEKVRIGGYDSFSCYSMYLGTTLTADQIIVRNGVLMNNGTVEADQLTFKEGSYYFSTLGGSIVLDGGNIIIEEGVDAADHVGWGNTEVITTGARSSIEVAGEDMGADEDGLDENFAIDTLTIGDGQVVGRMRLENMYENQGGSDEALYVENLILGANSGLNLGGMTLYYETITIGEDAIITDTVGGGMLMQIGAQEADELTIPGDANLDGYVTGADWTIWKENLDTGTLWTQGDFNLDGIVSSIDLVHWLAHYGEGGGVPEPATISLLGLGLTCLLGRRRRK